MLDSLLQNIYWAMGLQVVITLLILPHINAKLFKSSIESYLSEYYPEARNEVEVYAKSKLQQFSVTTIICMLICSTAVLIAFFTKTELFNWDNQAGLTVLFFIAFIPVLLLTVVQKGVFEIFQRYVSSKRQASLKPRMWSQYFSKRMVALLVFGQIFFIVTIWYFLQHPFDGFAGLSNLWGLLLINTVFLATSIAIIRSNKLNTIKDLSHREALVMKRMKINLFAWIIAIWHLSVSVWLAGLDVRDYSLLLQSFYLQLVLCMSAYALLPVAISRNSMAN